MLLRKPGRYLSTMILIVLIMFISRSATGITRGRLLKEVFDSLGIPPTSDSISYSDVSSNHQFFNYIQTARALGIIFPGDRFHPDMEITRAESIMFIFNSMGWAHEAQLAGLLNDPYTGNIPPYISPYLVLGGQVQPPVPENLLKNPAQNLQNDDLASIMQWIKRCRQEIIWHMELIEQGITLIIHREGIGTPPETWSIQINEFEDIIKARSIKKKLDQMGLETYITHDGCSYILFLGPFDHYAKAWEILKKIPATYSGNIVPTGKQSSNALFWTALVSTPSRERLSIITAPQIGGYRLPLSHMARNAEAIGAVNGGYFVRRYPIGTLVENNFPLSAPYGKRSAVAWNSNGDMKFSNGFFRTFVRLKDREIPITSINQAPGMDSMALFTRLWGTFATSIPDDAMELTVKRDKVTARKQSSMSNHFLPEDGYLLVARGNASPLLEQISINSPVGLTLRWDDNSMEPFSSIIQGGPLLVKNGSIVLHNEGLSKNVSDFRHPRTIVGSKGNKMFWIVIDGRNSWHSSGLTLDETRKFAITQGLGDALNLDGGGSSELWWKGSIINSIPGGKERKLPYCIIFRKDQDCKLD